MRFKKSIIFTGISCLAFTALGSINTQNLSRNTGIAQCQSIKASTTNGLSALQPKQVAAAILTIGSKDNPGWRSLHDSATDGDGDLNIDLIHDTEDSVTEEGTGMLYRFSIDGDTAMEINCYTISPDGNTIYLYSEGEHGSAERTIAPFKTISAKQVIKVAHTNSTVDEIAANAKIEADD